MGVLRKLCAAALLLPLAACYEPHLAQCTVRCSSDQDCAPGQACGAPGWCAAPGTACPAGADAPGDPDPPPSDAPADARPIDARPDGGPKVLLHVRVDGDGEVQIQDTGTCDSEGPEHGDCRFSATAGVALLVRAAPHAGFRFERWTSAACGMAGLICQLTPIDPLTELHAKFVRE